MYADGPSNSIGGVAELILISPTEEKSKYALRFGFKASNNEAKYEALIARLQLAKALGVKSLKVHSGL